MGYGRCADRIAGGLSRLLHLRGATYNTVGYLYPYLDLPRDVMFPTPPKIKDLGMRRTLSDRALRASTLTWTSHHEVIDTRYRERHELEYQCNRSAYARWVRPEGKRRDTCLIYVHGWLEPGSWAEEATLFRKWSREPDIDIVHVTLPFHGLRKPGNSIFSGEFFWTADLVRSLEGVRQAVCDTRSIHGWLREQGYSRVGITGLSLGGAITMLCGCLEPAPDFIIPIISHLHLENAVETAPILWRMKADLERWGIDRRQRHDLFFRVGLSSYLPVLPPSKQLWIQAREDVYIDAKLAEEQWREWGEPNILWIDGGHMTFPFHVNAITSRMGAFLGSS